MPALPTTSFANRPRPPIPTHVLAGAAAAGLLVTAAAALLMRPSPPKSPPGAVPSADSAAADTAFDVRWQGQRKDGADCIATFEVTKGTVTGRFIASVMDSSGGVMGSDSTDVAAAGRGKRIDLRFRRVNCAKIGDWQLQVLTPKTPAK